MRNFLVVLGCLLASAALAADDSSSPERVWTMMPARADVGTAWLLNTATGQMYDCNWNAGPSCSLAPLRDGK